MNHELDLFKKLFDSNDIWNADIVIKNLFNKNPGNTEIFNAYFQFSIKVAQWPIDIDTRKIFIGQAQTAVIFFAENTNIDVNKLEVINECKSLINSIKEEIYEIEKSNIDKHIDESQSINNQILMELVKVKNDLYYCKNEKDFEELLIKVSEKEARIDKSILTIEQNNIYDNLTKDYTKIINNKMLEFNNNSNIEYNKNAVDDFNYVFKEFTKNEKEYKEGSSKLYSLAQRYLFSYDASRLFNETLIYYNHVYSYIFNKLDDDNKFRFTKISIETEKLR